MWDRRVSEAEVARVLGLIADPPGLSDDAEQPGHLRRFEDGVVRYETGFTVYEFSDGTRAAVGVHPWLSVNVTFPDGRRVSVLQEEQ
ncbi:MAG: hypothetical protein M3362_01985 [Acidobacteriota bacterium]|nr:hypothetical protein [Acidobacteriota bacterium]